MKKDAGSATMAVIGIMFILICTLFFFFMQTQGGNDLLMKVLGSMQLDASPSVIAPDPQEAYMGKKITLPDGTIGCKQDELACPDGRIEKRIPPACMFPRCP